MTTPQTFLETVIGRAVVAAMPELVPALVALVHAPDGEARVAAAFKAAFAADRAALAAVRAVVDEAIAAKPHRP